MITTWADSGEVERCIPPALCLGGRRSVDLRRRIPSSAHPNPPSAVQTRTSGSSSLRWAASSSPHLVPPATKDPVTDRAGCDGFEFGSFSKGAEEHKRNVSVRDLLKSLSPCTPKRSAKHQPWSRASEEARERSRAVVLWRITELSEG